MTAEVVAAEAVAAAAEEASTSAGLMIFPHGDSRLYWYIHRYILICSMISQADKLHLKNLQCRV